jgi:serine/threonine protein kinase
MDATTGSLSSTRSFVFGIEPGLLRTIDIDDLGMGRVLGSGSFCVVTEIKILFTSLRTSLPEHSETSQDGDWTPGDKKYVTRSRVVEDETAYFARKRVRSELRLKRPEIYSQGLEDLAYEAELLSVMIDHPNIISLYGVSTLGASDFIVVERLHKTLAQRIVKWARIERQSTRGFLRPSRKKLTESYEDRIEAALSLASVIEYLHGNDIVYRDLKPENIGFDDAGNLKLFHFGMAKRLLAADVAEDGVHYNLTAMTGTRRYMAPEVGLGKPYNSSVDIYSWALIMWYLLKLEVPFGSKCAASTIVFDVVGYATCHL